MLYLSATGALHNFSMLRKGTRVTIYNVHPRQHSHNHTIEMYGCLRSSVDIIQFPEDIDISQSVLDLELTPILQSNGAQFCQKWRFETLVLLVEKLRPQAQKMRDMLSIMEKLLEISGMLPANIDSLTVPRVLSSLHLDACPVLSQTNGLPLVSKIADIKQMAEAECSLCSTKNHDETEHVQESKTYAASRGYMQVPQNKSQPMMVVGQLKLNRKTANVQIADQTGAIDLVCISRDASDFRNSNDCCQCCQFCFSNESAIDNFEATEEENGNRELRTCCFVHCGNIGSLIAIKAFDLVMETFQDSQQNSDNSSEQNLGCTHRIYLKLSMKDTIQLSAESSPYVAFKRIEKHKDSNLLETNQKPNILKSDMGQQICDKFKQISCESDTQLKKTSEKASTSGNIKVETEVTRIVSKLRTCDISDGVSVVQDFVVIHKDSLTVRSQGGGASPRLCFYCLVYFVGGARVIGSAGQLLGDMSDHGLIENETVIRSEERTMVSQMLYQTQTQSAKSEASRQIVMCFDADSARWFHLLHSGARYTLLKPNSTDTKCFQTKFASQVLKRGVLKSRARHLLHVTSDVIIAQQDHPSTCDKHLSPVEESNISGLLPVVKSVKELLEDSEHDQELVHVCGVIRERSLTDSQHAAPHGVAYDKQSLLRLGVWSLSNKHIRILLHDPDQTNCTLPVYINPQSISYPLGLTPGAQVVMYKLEKKRSTKGKVYAQYTNASTCRILGQRAVGILNDATSQTYEVNQQCVSTFLSHILSTDDSSTMEVLVSIQRVLKLVLKNTCTGCKQIVRVTADEQLTPCACQTPRCQLSVKASVMVEDGSSNALVHCDGNTVFTLLALTTEQTDALKSLACREGEIILEKDDSDLTGVMRFLRLLTLSDTVKRRVLLRVKKYSLYSYSWHALTLDDMKYRRIGSGERAFDTLSLPIMHLDCLHLQEVDPASVATALLSEPLLPTKTVP